MRKKSIILIIIVVFIFATKIYYDFDQEQKRKVAEIKSKNEKLKKELSVHIRGGTSDDIYKQKFENVILGLLFLAVNDTVSPWGMKRKIDMKSRTKYFSNNAWIEYNDFVTNYKTLLKEESDTRWSEASFLYKSQRYTQITSDLTFFCAVGNFRHTSGDSYGLNNKFKINIKYKIEDSKNPEDLIINDWNIKVLPKEEEITVNDCEN